MISKHQLDIFLSIVLILLSVLIFFTSQGMPPDAGGFPKFLSLFLGVCALILLITSLKKNKIIKIKADKKAIFVFLLITITLIIYYIALIYLGFIISSIILVFSILYIFEAANVIKNLIISVLIVMVIYYIFHKLLNVPLPHLF